jgi:hypothetical protein
MVMVNEGLIRKANARAQRRFHAMLEAQAYADAKARETILYVQSERLMDALLTELTWETRKAELDFAMSQDHDMHARFNLFVTECDICCCDPESPGIPADEFLAYMESWAPGEYVEAFGR